MADAERNGAGPFDEFIEEQLEESRERIRQGRPGLERRLQRVMSTGWGEMLALSQPKVPREIMKIGKGKLPEVAIITLWLSPSPWKELKQKDLREDSILNFVNRRQSTKWKEGKRNSVISYFQKMVDDKLPTGSTPRIPKEIREFTRGRMNETTLKTFWVLPSPWLWGKDDRDYKLDSRRSPSGMWKDNDHDLVIAYMRVLADKLEPSL